jgi:hypothetical protein
MRLSKARIYKYRSIRDTGEFEIEDGKTMWKTLVSAINKALK